MMTITTSWDDGHPLDLRLAEMLDKHGLKATFYVPRQSDRPTMSEAQIRQLGQRFEIGAHTLGHVDLTSVPAEVAEREIRQGKAWVEDVSGRPCAMFCPPIGRFYKEHLRLVEEAGFRGARTVELLSVDRPRRVGGLRVMPTTVQAYPHSPMVYVKNAIKRKSLGNLWFSLTSGSGREWVRLVKRGLERAVRCGGVFHLWGHSWEIEEAGQWGQVETALRLLSEAGAECAANGTVCVE